LFLLSIDQTNGSAYALAQAALSHASRNIFDVIPNYIAIIIMNEILLICLRKRVETNFLI
jgi:hypothetical protein